MGVCAILFLLAGCASYTHITLRVRDRATQQPVEGARVTVRPLNFFIPVHPYPHFFPGSTTSRGDVTGFDGTVQLMVVSNAPSQITVVRAGYLPYRATLRPAGGDGEEAGLLRWMIESEERTWSNEHSSLIVDILPGDPFDE